MDFKNGLSEKIDREILSLFPSLDFNRSGVHIQSKQGMKRNLSILKKTAKVGRVTKYMLTDERSDLRMGGQSAQNGLVALVRIGLLREEKTKNEKGTVRIDRKLTPKGIIACMVFPEFQQKDELDHVLKRSDCKESKLASSLTLYNNTFVREKIVDESKISPSVLLIKKLARQGFNLERKSEEMIVQDIRRTEEKGFLDSMKTSPIDLVSSLMFSRQDTKKQNQFQSLLKLMDENAPNLKELNELLKDDPNKSEFIEVMNSFLRNILLFFTSQELITWAKTEPKTLTIDQLAKIAKQRMNETGNEFENPIEKILHLFPMMQKILRENFEEKHL